MGGCGLLIGREFDRDEIHIVSICERFKESVDIHHAVGELGVFLGAVCGDLLQMDVRVKCKCFEGFRGTLAKRNRELASKLH